MLVLVLILAVTAIPIGSFAANNNDIKVTINGKQLYFDVNPLSIDGRILVPMRGIFEALAAEIK